MTKRYRKLRPDHAYDPDVRRLDDRAHRIWMYLLCPCADDMGRLLIDTDDILAAVYPLQREVTIVDIEAALLTICGQTLLKIYQNGSGQLLGEIDPVKWKHIAEVERSGYVKQSILPARTDKNTIQHPSVEHLRNASRTLSRYSATLPLKLNKVNKENKLRRRDKSLS